jgi:ABC-2 type transport system permease protein
VKAFRKLARRELAAVLSTPMVTLLVFAAPVVYGLFYGTIYCRKSERDVPIVVADLDRSAFSRTLIRSLDAHNRLRVAEVCDDPETGRERMLGLEAFGLVVVPEGSGAALKSRRPADVALFVNAGRFLVANDVNRAVTETVLTLSAGMRVRALQSLGRSPEQALAQAEPLTLDVRPLFNPAESYGDFFLPGLLWIIWQQTLMIAVAVGFIREREEGTLAEGLSAAGDRPAALAAAKAAVYAAFWSVYALFFFGVLFPAYRLPVRAGLPLLASLTLLQTAAATAMGALASTFFDRKVDGLQFLILTSYPFFLLSGFSMPLQSMPAGVRAAAAILPSTPFIQGSVRAASMGAGWRSLAPALGHLALLAAGLAALAAWRLASAGWKRTVSASSPAPAPAGAWNTRRPAAGPDAKGK